jgi:excinuclease ABC subunit B
MDADKEGFLRSRSSLIQTSGRAARNANSKVLFYADSMTDSMNACIAETERRREIQIAYNTKHGITPKTIEKKLSDSLRQIYGLTAEDGVEADTDSASQLLAKNSQQLDRLIRRKANAMQKAAGKLEFEQAAELRDEINQLKALLISFAEGGDA